MQRTRTVIATIIDHTNSSPPQHT